MDATGYVAQQIFKCACLDYYERLKIWHITIYFICTLQRAAYFLPRSIFLCISLSYPVNRTGICLVIEAAICLIWLKLGISSGPKYIANMPLSHFWNILKPSISMVHLFQNLSIICPYICTYGCSRYTYIYSNSFPPKKKKASPETPGVIRPVRNVERSPAALVSTPETAAASIVVEVVVVSAGSGGEGFSEMFAVQVWIKYG